MPIKEGMEDEAMYVGEDIGPLFGVNDIYLRSSSPWDGSTCVLQTQLGIVYKLPEGHEDEKVTFLTGAQLSNFDEYEIFFEQ